MKTTSPNEGKTCLYRYKKYTEEQIDEKELAETVNTQIKERVINIYFVEEEPLLGKTYFTELENIILGSNPLSSPLLLFISLP